MYCGSSIRPRNAPNYANVCFPIISEANPAEAVAVLNVRYLGNSRSPKILKPLNAKRNTNVIHTLLIIDFILGIGPLMELVFHSCSNWRFPQAHSNDVVLCSLCPPERWSDAGVGIGILRGNTLLSAN